MMVVMQNTKAWTPLHDVDELTIWGAGGRRAWHAFISLLPYLFIAINNT